MLLNIKFVECPHCGTWYSTTELMSYTTFGSNQECWSDGKCINSNIPEYSFMPFSKCDNCNKFFWFDECRQLQDYQIKQFLDDGKKQNHDKQINENDKELVSTFLKDNKDKYQNNGKMDLDYPPMEYWFDLPISFINEYLEILKSEKLKPDNEIYIRIKLWQHINDLRRRNKIRRFKQIVEFIKNKKLYYKYSTIHIENMKRLSEMIENSNEYIDNFPLLVELYRELGNFTKSKSIIENSDPTEIQYYKDFVAMSKKMIKNKETKLFKI